MISLITDDPNQQLISKIILFARLHRSSIRVENDANLLILWVYTWQLYLGRVHMRCTLYDGSFSVRAMGDMTTLSSNARAMGDMTLSTRPILFCMKGVVINNMMGSEQYVHIQYDARRIIISICQQFTAKNQILNRQSMKTSTSYNENLLTQ